MIRMRMPIIAAQRKGNTIYNQSIMGEDEDCAEEEEHVISIYNHGKEKECEPSQGSST
jgi:hypothetical protein